MNSISVYLSPGDPDTLTRELGERGIEYKVWTDNAGNRMIEFDYMPGTLSPAEQLARDLPGRAIKVDGAYTLR